jgi:hypothetical protein
MYGYQASGPGTITTMNISKDIGKEGVVTADGLKDNGAIPGVVGTGFQVTGVDK